jgi:hypothetical protein
LVIKVSAQETNYIKDVLDKVEQINNSIKSSGGHIDFSKKDSIIGETISFSWTTLIVNDSNFIKRLDLFSEHNTFIRDWYIKNNEIIFCFEDGTYNGQKYQLKYFIESMKIKYSEDDQLLPKEIIEAKYAEITKEIMHVQ